MADTPVPESRARRIPVIVMERPALDWGRLILGVLVGLAAGALLGMGLWGLAAWGADDMGKEWLFAPRLRYTVPVAVIGLLGGLAWGWGWGRGLQARIELVEIAPTVRELHRRRRHSVSTEIDSAWSRR